VCVCVSVSVFVCVCVCVTSERVTSLVSHGHEAALELIINDENENENGL